MDKIKEFIGKLDVKIKKAILVGAGGVLIFAIIVALALNNKPYDILFSKVNEEEAQQIIGKLQEKDVAYQYKEGDILVEKDLLEKTKADLVYEGYPKTGFTYDVFRENTSLMTTESDKQTYKVFELQNRIGATICLFDGVKDAKVTIALGEENKYALGEEKKEASATATVITENGEPPTKEQAQAIQRLVSKSIPGMVFQNVSVFDGNGIEITNEEVDETTKAGKTNAELVQVIERQIERNVLNVLVPIYGTGNVRVSPKATLNMEQLVRESIQYTTPDKIDGNDKGGIVQKEELSEDRESSQDAQGIAGTESNADIPEYNADGQTNEQGYLNTNKYREYLVNQIKEQGQISPGVLEDLTISVAINGKNLGELTQDQVRGLIGNASGMDVSNQEEKITVVSAPFFQDGLEQKEAKKESKVQTNIIWILIVGVGVLVVICLGLLVLKKKKKKKGIKGEQETIIPVVSEKMDEKVINLQNEKGMQLKRSIRDFAEQNPEISAQLLKTWLNGGDQNE